MYICEDCKGLFTSLRTYHKHDGIITQTYKGCPCCGSKKMLCNEKKMDKDELFKWLKARGLL